MEIGVASGKGGTGKTTIATNLAVAIGSNVRILDCDVDEPNAHLFLNPNIEKREYAFLPIPKIDEDKCSLCEKCVLICRFNAIARIGESILTFPELCHSCGGCMEVCPEGAITEAGRKLGLLESGCRENIMFAHGRLRVGEAMAPPLIRMVRSSCTENGVVTIIDAPPGTSCPVITSIRDTDFVLMVTEPTPFGLHDLHLAVEAVKLLGIPSGLIINRADIGNHDVRDYARRESMPVLMEMPFDRKIAEVYSKGRLIVEELPEWKERFVALFKKIKKTIG